MIDDLELVRRLRSEVPYPDGPAWANARGELLRAIDAEKHPTETRRPRRWWRSKRFLACALAVLVGGGSAAAAVISSERSQPLTGRFPPAAGGGRSIGGLDYSITVTPQLQAGSIGWCDLVAIGHNTGASCGSTPALGDPIADGGSGGFRSEPYEYMLTTSQVAAVRIGSGPTVLTRTDPNAPAGLRVAVFVLRGKARSEPYPRTALNAQGKPIAFTNSSSALQPTRSWKAAMAPARGACSLHTPAGSGIRPLAGSVLDAITPDPALVSHVFLSCINTAYELPAAGGGAREVIVAALLLDARHPGTAVGPLPGMQRVASHPTVLNTVSQTTATIPYTTGELGGLSARQIGNDAWLIAAGGTSLQQRIRVLDELRVGTIHLRPPTTPPRAPADAICRITFRPLPSLTEISQTTHTASGLPVCIEASFYYQRHPMLAATVTTGPAHAQGPAVTPPRPVAGHPRTFTTRFDSTLYPDIYATWRKTGKTWLAVTGGTPTQQLALIDTITLHTKNDPK